MAAQQAAEAGGELLRDPANASERRARTQALRPHDWVAYAKTPLAGPTAVLDCLSRYTHRTAIGHERLVGIQRDTVRLRMRIDDCGGKRTHHAPSAVAVGTGFDVYGSHALHERACVLLRLRVERRHGQQPPRLRQPFGLGRRRQQPVVVDALEATGQNVLQLGESALARRGI